MAHYLHLSSLQVSEGEPLARGQLPGTTGLGHLLFTFNADRMVMDYVRGTYLPAAAGATSRL